MNIAILTFVSSKKRLAKGTKSIIKECQSRGHKVKILFSPYVGLKFGVKSKLSYKGKPFKVDQYDAIVVRPGFSSEPSVNASIIKQFQLAGFHVINGYIGVFRAKNKIRTMQMLDHFGIPVPKTLVVRDPSLITAAAQSFKFPVIVKSIFGTHGRGVFIAESKRSLNPIVEYITAKEKGPVSLQEYIAEAKGKDLRILTLGKKAVAAMERSATGSEFRANFHKQGTVAAAKLTKEEKLIAVKAAQVLNLDIAGVDILRTKKGPKVIEVNSNPGFEGLSKATGINIQKKIVDFIEHRISKNTSKKPISKRKMTE